MAAIDTERRGRLVSGAFGSFSFIFISFHSNSTPTPTRFTLLNEQTRVTRRSRTKASIQLRHARSRQLIRLARRAKTICARSLIRVADDSRSGRLDSPSSGFSSSSGRSMADVGHCQPAAAARAWQPPSAQQASSAGGTQVLLACTCCASSRFVRAA